jgi:methionyl-tRNA formyltransferase
VTRARLIDAVEGKLEALPQDPTRATVAPMLSKGDAPIDLRAGAAAIDAHVRAMQPWPGATLTLPDGKILKVTRIAPIDAGTIPSGVDRAPGDVLIADKFGLVVACGPAAEESFAILDAQPEGKRVMSAGDLVNGRVVARGMKLTGRA